MSRQAVIRPLPGKTGELRVVDVGPEWVAPIGEDEELVGILEEPAQRQIDPATWERLVGIQNEALQHSADALQRIAASQETRAEQNEVSLELQRDYGRRQEESLQIARDEQAQRNDVAAALMGERLVDRNLDLDLASQAAGSALEFGDVWPSEPRVGREDIVPRFRVKQDDKSQVAGSVPVLDGVGQRVPADGLRSGQGVGTDPATEPRRYAVLRDPATAPSGWVNQVKVLYGGQAPALEEAMRLAGKSGGRFLVLEVNSYAEASPRIWSGDPDPPETRSVEDALTDLAF